MTITYLHCSVQEVYLFCGLVQAEIDGRVEIVEIPMQFFKVLFPVGSDEEDVTNVTK